MDAPPPRKRAVFARHAASLLLWRAGPDGPEVLMGMRGAGHRFVPNRLVFPGGAVDPADKRARAAREPDPSLLAMLGRNAAPPLARALVVAAARELAEEAGLSFGDPPELHRIDYLCRAVTPPPAPIRFNARFLIAPATAASGEPADSRELEGVRFYALAQALALDLMAVTREVLLRAETYLRQDNEARGERELFVFKRRRWVPEQGAR
jgi:8-oxo-dGTP pyrophosphatase MutT (NUDIX family)